MTARLAELARLSLITLTSTQPDVNASRSTLAAAFEDGRPLPRTSGMTNGDWDGNVLLARQGGLTCGENTLLKR
jgi:undecaprenyl-diphosphatase